MAIDLRFSFLCDKRWVELQGSDPIRRFCPDCSRDIINLDPMSDAERGEVFREARETGKKPCVFATVRNPDLTPGSETPEEDDFPPHLGGEPELDYDPFADDEPDDVIREETQAVRVPPRSSADFVSKVRERRSEPQAGEGAGGTRE